MCVQAQLLYLDFCEDGCVRKNMLINLYKQVLGLFFNVILYKKRIRSEHFTVNANSYFSCLTQ